MFPPAGTSPSGLLSIGGGSRLLVSLAIGVFGGAHRLGMCGPPVTLYADRMGAESDRGRPIDVRQHPLFDAGRTASYALIGGFIAVTGLGHVVRGSVGHGSSIPPVGSAFSRVYAAVTTRVDRWVGGPRIVGPGALRGVLPRPLLYPAFLYAFAVGSPARGAPALAVLGLGPVPTLLAYGTAFRSLDAGTRVGLHRVLGVCFVVLGYLLLAHGLTLAGIHLPHPPIPVYQPLG